MKTNNTKGIGQKSFSFSFFCVGLLAAVYFSNPAIYNDFITPRVHDTVIISHSLDGSTSEWPDSSFTTNQEYKISYAADNDQDYFYIAMRIPDFAEQMKIMRMGMRCFIDLKAKKKDNMGIEYPVVNELTANSTTSNPPPPEGEPRAAFDPKKYRESFMMNMIFLKLFGFDDMEEDKKQSLVMKNNVNIYFEWDAANVMHLEYRVPLKMLMDKGPLQGREISLGWKINGVEIQSTTTTSTAPGARTGRRSTPTRPSRPVSSQQTVDKMMKDQFIWTKYVFKLK